MKCEITKSKREWAKKIVKTEKAPPPIGAYNQAVWGGDTLYISGQIAIEPEKGKMIEGNVGEETEQVMQSIGAILQEAGLDFDSVVKCTLLLQEISDFQTVNEVYSRFFEEETAPAREAFQVEDLPKGASIEISAVAVKD